MQAVPFYIAYLLSRYECVIIPGFGAFISSIKERKKIFKEGLLFSPSQSLGFNSEIKHNDGLLANTLSKSENISYKESCSQIRLYVDSLNDQLKKQKYIQIPWVGKLSLSREGQVIFTPSIHLSCNANYFGLSNFYMPALSELEIPNRNTNTFPKKKEKRKGIFIPVNRRVVRWISVAAASVAALFASTTPLNDYSSIDSQQAALFSFLPKPTKIIAVVNEAKSLLAEDILCLSDINQQPQNVAENNKAENSDSAQRRYYIIIASLTSLHLAEQQMEEFKKNGFSTVDIISTTNKHRIYIDKFENKQEAEKFLEKFRIDYPKYTDAWLLSQQN
jgi:nucleoid DNA-binding protein